MIRTEVSNLTDLRISWAANVVTTIEVRDPHAYRASSRRLLGRFRFTGFLGP